MHLLAPDPLPRPHLEMDSISPLTAAVACPVSGLLFFGLEGIVDDAVEVVDEVLLWLPTR